MQYSNMLYNSLKRIYMNMESFQDSVLHLKINKFQGNIYNVDTRYVGNTIYFMDLFIHVSEYNARV